MYLMKATYDLFPLQIFQQLVGTKFVCREKSQPWNKEGWKWRNSASLAFFRFNHPTHSLQRLPQSSPHNKRYHFQTSRKFGHSNGKWPQYMCCGFVIKSFSYCRAILLQLRNRIVPKSGLYSEGKLHSHLQGGRMHSNCQTSRAFRKPSACQTRKHSSSRKRWRWFHFWQV